MAGIDRAVQIAAQAHAGQKDKDGQPYVLHPLRVMQAVEGEAAKMAAVLHDVIEDTAVTADDLRQAGIDEATIAAVLCVTHNKDESYADYVVRCKGNEVARQVKLADLADNARLERALLRPDRFKDDLKRIHRYYLSYKFLTGRITEEQYRALMAEHG